MKDAGDARKRRGVQGRATKKQHHAAAETDVPIWSAVGSDNSRDSSETAESTSPETSESSNSTNATEYDDVSNELVLVKQQFPVDKLHAPNKLSYIAINLFSNYETARAKFMIDVNDLAILTNFNISKNVTPIFTADPTRLASLLGHKQWYVLPIDNLLILSKLTSCFCRSYLQYVPSRYGSSPCITAATNCLLGKVKSVLAPQDHCKDVTIRLYSKALLTLQDAISDGTDCMEADVLCATRKFDRYSSS